MANPQKGEVDFEARGRTFTLRFSTNAICELEDKLDRSFTSIGQDLMNATTSPERIRFSTLRAMFWAALQDHHPDVDLKMAGDLMVESGGMASAMELISDALARAFPAQETKGTHPTKQSRPVAMAGTGKPS